MSPGYHLDGPGELLVPAWPGLGMLVYAHGELSEEEYEERRAKLRPEE